MQDPSASETQQLAALRELVTAATQRLLGNTIVLSDDDWRASSRLPRWTRAHVGTHLARHAEALLRLVAWARTGERQDMYASLQQRDDDIDAGSGRSGLDLQIDLDTTAGQLAESFDSLDDEGWARTVELRGGLQVPARLLPLARLTEVVLHHVDLNIGFEVGDIDQATAEWLLEWSAFRLRSRDEFPRLDLTSDSGFRIAVGSSGDAMEVTGSSAQLLGWLTGRAAPSSVTGSNDLVLPPF